jgi:hypothetical protein
MIMEGNYPGKSIHRSGAQIIKSAVKDDWGGALELAYRHLTVVKAEQAQANAAADLLERWAKGSGADVTARPLRIGDVVKLLGVSQDILRNWERNGLLEVPRQENNAYRMYGPQEISRLRVIRMLANAGYSQMAILRMLLQLDGVIRTTCAMRWIRRIPARMSIWHPTVGSLRWTRKKNALTGLLIISS